MKYSYCHWRNALSGHQNWQPAWRSPDPKPHYDVIIVGGGGHGLATAYYLAKNHGITNVAVLEKGYLGSAMSAATPPSSGPTTCCRATTRSTSSR
jgi:NADPH-dependent 2,4-dienoyl-CoA reductase/sulfur reductase-like enzyme